VLRLDNRSTIDWLDNMDPAPPPTLGARLVPIGPDTVATEPLSDENVGQFLRDDSGAIRWLLMNHRAARRRDS
jgi:hypothetical protein